VTEIEPAVIAVTLTRIHCAEVAVTVTVPAELQAVDGITAAAVHDPLPTGDESTWTRHPVTAVVVFAAQVIVWFVYPATSTG
jgi:hypothetical protein